MWNSVDCWYIIEEILCIGEPVMLQILYTNLLNCLQSFYSNVNQTISSEAKKLENKLNWLIQYVSISENPSFLHNRQVPDLKRGNIILVEIGDNLGMEFSGRHHCIVLRDSPIGQDQVFVLPITSKKPGRFTPNYNGIYIEFPAMRGFNGFSDNNNPQHPDTGKHWANILNVRNISKSRIVYPTKIRTIENGQLNRISECIIANIALRRDLLN